MSRTALIGLLVVVVAGLSGCASPAKIIQQDGNQVVVAIPDNTNSWPYYYKDEANKVATEILQDPVLVGTTRVKVGEQVTNLQDTTRRDIGGDNKPKVGDFTTSRSTTSVSDTYEYRLVFQRRDANRLPNFSRANVTPPAPTPGGPPLTITGGGAPSAGSGLTPVGGLNPPSLPPTPAPDVMPPLNPPASPATNIPSTLLPAPGQGGR